MKIVETKNNSIMRNRVFNLVCLTIVMLFIFSICHCRTINTNLNKNEAGPSLFEPGNNNVDGIKVSEQRRIDSLISAGIKDGGAGATTIIMQNGKIIYLKAFGKANVELDTDMKPDYVFRLGSITKQFTACAILKLAEEGKLSIQDDIRKYLPDYPTEGKLITIENLLTHTSGIKSYTDLPEWTSELQRKNFTPIDFINYFKRDKLDFIPGEKFMYSNTGYFILGYIIEQVSGKTYNEYITENFFKSLGMKNSCYDKTSAIIKNRVPGYQLRDGKLVNAGYISMTQPFSAGSLLSTVEDLALWYKAVFSYKVISKESLAKAHTEYTLKDGSKTGYGYGWIIGERFGKPTVEHGGSINGFLSKDLYFPKEDLFIAVFSNSQGYKPDETVNQIASILLKVSIQKKEVALTKEQMNNLSGQYELNPDLIITVIMEDNKLYADAPGQGKFTLIPDSETEFTFKEIEAEIKFEFTDGKATGLVLNRSGMIMKAKRVEPKVNNVQVIENKLYRVEEITIQANDFTIIGDLYIPLQGEKHPVAIWVHGSGAVDRKFMAPLLMPQIELFIKAGYAFFIDDIPGSGASKGEIRSVYTDRAMILNKEVETMKNRPDIIPSKIGVVGNSQAGIVMPLAISQTTDIAFMIAEGCVAECSYKQDAYLLENFMISENVPAEDAQKAALTYLTGRYTDNYKEYVEAIETISKNPQAELIGINYSALSEEKFRARNKSEDRIGPYFNPMPLVSRIKIPVLAMFGSKDKNINPVQGYEAYNKSLKEAGNNFYRVDMIPNANHASFEAETGSVRELQMQVMSGKFKYSQLMLSTLSSWIEELKGHLLK